VTESKLSTDVLSEIESVIIVNISIAVTTVITVTFTVIVIVIDCHENYDKCHCLKVHDCAYAVIHQMFEKDHMPYITISWNS